MDLYKGMDQLRGLSELYRQMNNPPAPEGEDIQEGDFWHPDPNKDKNCLLYTSPSPRDQRGSRMPSSA